MTLFRVAGGGPLPPGVETDLSKLKAWWISGVTTTASGTGPFRIIGGANFEQVHHNLISCHRDCDTVETITSPEGVEMTEATFYEMWKAEKSKGNA